MECGGTGWIGAFGEHGILRTSALAVEGCAREVSRVSSVSIVFPRVTGEGQLSELAFVFFLFSTEQNFSDSDHKLGDREHMQL